MVRKRPALPIEGSSLEELLTDAIQNINGSVMEYEVDDPESEEEDRSIPADPSRTQLQLYCCRW